MCTKIVEYNKLLIQQFNICIYLLHHYTKNCEDFHL